MKTADGYPVVCYGVKGKYNIHRICRRWAEENARSLNKK